MRANMNDIYEMVADVLDADIEQFVQIDPGDDLAKHGMTSILFIHLVIALEDKYEFEFKDEDLLFDRFNTLNKLAELLNRYLQ